MQSISLEETNQLRIKLGLKPLVDDRAKQQHAPVTTTDSPVSHAASVPAGASDDASGPSTAPRPAAAAPKDKDAEAEENYRRKRADDQRARQEKEARTRLEKLRNRRAFSQRLQGPTLGQDDDDAGRAPPPPSSNADDSGQRQEEEPSTSTYKWLKQQRKRAKQNAARLAREREEAEVESVRALQRSYGEKDLAGLRVAHDWDELNSRLGSHGEEGVKLTLKDSHVLDDEGDELVESSLVQTEQDQERTERAKGVAKYTGLDDDEFGDNLLPSRLPPSAGHAAGTGGRHDRDVDIEMGANGTVRADSSDRPKGFVLGETPITDADRAEERRKLHEQAAAARQRTLVDLNYDKTHMASDYLQAGEPGFKIKKPKKKRKATQKVQLDDPTDDASAQHPSIRGEGMDVDLPNSQDRQPSNLDQVVLPARSTAAAERDANFVDDDELSAALARTRRQKSKKVLNKITPETIARNLAAQKKAEEEEAASAAGGVASVVPRDLGGVEAKPSAGLGDPEGSSVTFDVNSEFVRHLRARQAEAAQEQAEAEVRRRRLASRGASSEPGGASSDPQAGSGPNAAAPDALPSAPDVEMADLELDLRSQQREQEQEQKQEQEQEQEQEQVPKQRNGAGTEEHATGTGEPVTQEEPLVSKGLASTLSLLRSANALETITPEQLEKEAQQRQQDVWLTRRKIEAKQEEEARRHNRMSGNFKDQGTRERENRERDAKLAQMAMDQYANYKPDVEIKYHDAFGRELTTKEAWKELSHKFHGRDPGFKAQEKLRRKRELQLQQEKMAAGDTPSGLAAAFNARAERTGQAHMVLSVGSRDNAPQDWSLGAGPAPPPRSASASGSASGAVSSARPLGVHSSLLGPGGTTSSGTMTSTSSAARTRLAKSGSGHGVGVGALPVLGEEEEPGKSRRRLRAAGAGAGAGGTATPSSSGVVSMVPRTTFKPGFAPVQPAPPTSAGTSHAHPGGGGVGGGLRLSLGKRKAPSDPPQEE